LGFCSGFGIDPCFHNSCPTANRRWRAQYPAMFDIKDGTVGTGVLNGVGLGF
jgi:hypothetical protein